MNTLLVIEQFTSQLKVDWRRGICTATMHQCGFRNFFVMRLHETQTNTVWTELMAAFYVGSVTRGPLVCVSYYFRLDALVSTSLYCCVFRFTMFHFPSTLWKMLDWASRRLDLKVSYNFEALDFDCYAIVVRNILKILFCALQWLICCHWM